MFFKKPSYYPIRRFYKRTLSYMEDIRVDKED